MPSTPRGHDVATLLAVILTAVLAVVWLRSSDDAAPAVPAGLSVETLPAVAPEEPAALDAVAPPEPAIEGKGPSGDQTPEPKAKRSRDDRAGGGEDARARRQAGARTRRGTAGEAGGQDPPATASAPPTGNGRSAVPSGGGVATSEPGPPEFALE